MLETLRDLYEEMLPHLTALAVKRSKLNVRLYSELAKRETGQGLSPAQYRELASDLSQTALADHWERYCKACDEIAAESAPGDELTILNDCANWLERSKLRFPRRFSLAGAGLSYSTPAAPYFTSIQGGPDTLCDSLLSSLQLQVLVELSAGMPEREIVNQHFGGDGGRQWKAYRAFKLELFETLSLVAQVAKGLGEFDEVQATLADLLKCERRAGKRLPPAPSVKPTGDEAFDLAHFYAKQHSPNPSPAPAVKAAPEPIDYCPVKVAIVPPTVSPKCKGCSYGCWECDW